MIIFDGQFKGLANSKWSGVAGSFAESVGIDGHSNPGTITVHQKLTKESSTIVTAFVKIAVTVSTGESFWFSSTDGKIWRRSNASPGVWLLVYTTAPVAGTAGCSGAMEYNGFLYWATQSRLHRISMATAIATAANWTTNAVPDWATFAVTDADFHPMAIQDLTLFIGDANRIVSVNSAGTFNNNALDIKTPLRIKTITDFEIDLLIGTYVADTINRTEIIRWDCVSRSWNTSDRIEEVGINAFIRDDNYIYVNAGRAGNIYFYNGETLQPFKKIPGTYSDTQYGTIHPGAVANFKGIPVFGFSNGAGNPAKQGVYSFGSYSRDYPKVLDLSWPLSTGTMATLEIGTILVNDFQLLVSWKDGSTYGVDAFDLVSPSKYASAYFETTMLAQDKRDVLKTLRNVSAFYNSLPANTGITFSYSVNGASYIALTSVTNAVLNEIQTQLSVDSIGSLQIKCSFTISGNTAPVVEAISVDIE